MNEEEIFHMLSKNVVTQQKFKAVLPSNRLPWESRKFNGDGYIFNFDAEGELGSHWVAIILNKDFSEYFDSYGEPPPKGLQFEQFMGNRCVYNPVKLQAALSTVCGQYCMLFLYQRYRGQSFKDFIKMFGRDYLVNDVFVNSAVESIFHTDEDIFDRSFIKDFLNSSSHNGSLDI
jgi:hypothetical protein